MAGSVHDRLSGARSAIDYQRIVLDEVRAGRFVADWVALHIVRAGHSLDIQVLARPLAIGPTDARVYVMASATLQQLVADELHALLPTSLVMDEIHRQATAHVAPVVQPAWVVDGSMGTPRRLVEQSDILASKFAALPDPRMIADGWKSWMLAKGLAAGVLREGVEQAFNHGLYTPSATSTTLGGEHAIQVLGGAHGRFEIDYSQVVLLMADHCTVDGAVRLTTDVLGDPQLARLLSDEGPLTVFRQPGQYGVTTFSLLSGPSTPPPANTHPTIRRGSTGPEVRLWQGVVGAKVDGVFGPETETKTRAWQAAHALIVDGIVGPATWKKAESILAPPAPPSILEGIDISSTQGTVHFDRVKAAGAQLVYLRASDGVGWTDPQFIAYASAAKSVGLPVGAYHYLRARPDADKQALEFVDRFRQAGCTLRPMVDCEPTNNATASGATWLAAILAFGRTVEEKLGVKPFVYGYPGFLDAVPELVNSTELAQYPLWIADYALQRPTEPWVPRPWKAWSAWQYAAGDHRGRVGRIDGVLTDVDRNRFRESLEALQVV